MTISLLYLHIKKQYVYNEWRENLIKIEDDLSKSQFQDICYDKLPFVYQYNITDSEKQFEKDNLLKKYSKYEINIDKNFIPLSELLTPDSSNNTLC